MLELFSKDSGGLMLFMISGFTCTLAIMIIFVWIRKRLSVIHERLFVAKRSAVDTDFKNKVLAETKAGNLKWSLTEDDHDWDGYDWTVFACEIDGKKLEFLPFSAGGALSVGPLFSNFELTFSETRSLSKAIEAAGFVNKIAVERKKRRLAYKEQLSQLATAL